MAKQNSKEGSKKHSQVPFKLVRSFKNENHSKLGITKLKDKKELNKLYRLKLFEEIEEIKASGHSDVSEFVDVFQTLKAWATLNGITDEELQHELMAKSATRGFFKNYVKPATPRKGNEVYYDKNLKL